MIYVLFAVIAALSTVAVLWISARKGVVNLGILNIYKPCEEEITAYMGKKMILLTIICFAVGFAIQISLYIHTSVINFIKLYGLFVIVFAAGVIDSKRKIIPNFLIIVGLVFRAGIYIYEVFFRADLLKSILFNDLIGVAVGFVFLTVASLLSKGGIGFGDAKLFGVIGIISGSFCTYSTLLVSLVIAAVLSLVKILRKKMDRKDTFPFGPCITMGYIIVVLLTSY